MDENDIQWWIENLYWPKRWCLNFYLVLFKWNKITFKRKWVNFQYYSGYDREQITSSATHHWGLPSWMGFVSLSFHSLFRESGKLFFDSSFLSIRIPSWLLVFFAKICISSWYFLCGVQITKSFHNFPLIFDYSIIFSSTYLRKNYTYDLNNSIKFIVNLFTLSQERHELPRKFLL